MDCLSDDVMIIRVSPFVVIKAFIYDLAILPAAHRRLAELGAVSVLKARKDGHRMDFGDGTEELFPLNVEQSID